ncbi:invasion protein IalB [Hasllibacter halocynthiae]|uniref:Invasion protein IalB n=1 Tax=Hasllibacter halocynthiae TaxID=595589 RepID=A0A2T0X8K2_9RHOB|nr:invasion associated locus B family protein [Hasllibacter halocynthiae]PRY95235.1 invasion protein IalB [Hasllibacter halocynthiae]
MTTRPIALSALLAATLAAAPLSAQDAATDDTAADAPAGAPADAGAAAADDAAPAGGGDTNGAADAGAEGAEDGAEAEGGTSVEDTDLNLAPDVIEVGDRYIDAEFTDWQRQCVRAPEDQEDDCQLYQLLRDQDGNPTAEMSVFPVPGNGEAVAGATIITPLETLLPEGLRLSVDGGEARGYPFTFCAAIGCFARIGFRQAEIDALKRGNAATIVINPVAAPDTDVELDVSLSGFTAGYDSLSE